MFNKKKQVIATDIKWKLPVTIFFLLLIFTLKADAQNLNSTVYSRFGLGDAGFKGYAHNLGIGQSGVSALSPFNLNYYNPAANVNLKLTTFTAGLSGIYSTQQNSTDTLTQKSAAFSYIGIGFPVTKWWGTAVGLIPYSTVNYSFKGTVTELGKPIETAYMGKGGINKVYWSNGFNPFKIFSDSLMRGFAIGLNSEFAFGNITKTSNLNYIDADTSYYFNIQNESRKAYKGFAFTIGVMQTIDFDSDSKITFGFSYGLKSKLNAVNNAYTTRYFYDQLNNNLLDTAYSINDTKSIFYIPQEFRFGVTIQQSANLSYTIEARLTKWGSDSVSAADAGYLKNSRSFMAGIQYLPNTRLSSSFLKHTYYRVGFRSAILPYYLNDTQIQENAITLGFGFPLRNSTSTVSLGVELGQRGTTANGLIKEKYILFNLGFTINDRWFIKSKFD